MMHRLVRPTISMFAVAVIGLVACSSGDAQPTPSKSTPAAACHLKVVEEGFSVTKKDDLRRGDGWWGMPFEYDQVRYGFIVKNPCHRVATNNWVQAVALSRSGHPVINREGKALLGSPTKMPVVMPGEQVGYGGYFYDYNGMQNSRDYSPDTVAGIRVNITHTDFVQSSTLKWPSVEISGLSVSEPDRKGLSTVAFTVEPKPVGTQLHRPTGVLVFRDKHNRIVSSQGIEARQGRQKLSIFIPVGADYSKTEVYVLQDDQTN